MISSKISKMILAISFVSVMLLVFQNCGAPLPEDGGLSSLNATDFAYDLKVDTFAYMSCGINSGLSGRDGFFNFKVGAYGDQSGLKFTDTFKKLVKYRTDDQIAEILSNSTKNGGAQIKMSFRIPGALQSALGTSGSTALTSDILYPLDQALIVQDFLRLEEGERFNFLSSVSGLQNRKVEGAIDLGGQTGGAFYSDPTSRNILLALTYNSTLSDDDQEAIAPEDGSRKNVYGTGFQLGFSDGGRQISHLEEVNLADDSSNGSWSCPDGQTNTTSMRFVIVKPGDTNTVGVDLGSDIKGGMSNSEIEIVKMVREILDPTNTKWYIDLGYSSSANNKVGPEHHPGVSFIYPKSSSGDDCYTSSYQSTSEDLVIDYNSRNYSTKVPPFPPEYLTVCFKL
ncbi:MAG: hypothetical protein HOO06_07330 [Bdellovibrionaceae bacterium]|nr:hypothetical protein [Pseudobdellovibrionaceae bacterium]